MASGSSSTRPASGCRRHRSRRWPSTSPRTSSAWSMPPRRSTRGRWCSCCSVATQVCAGELIGLRWCDVDLKRRQITVRQAAWQGVVDVPKGGRERIVEMTTALYDALKRHQHLRSERVLCCDDGSVATAKMCRTWIAVAQKRASLPQPGALHILRHTFCSRLAIAGAPPRAIQEAAGAPPTCRRRCGTCTSPRPLAVRPSICWTAWWRRRRPGPRARSQPFRVRRGARPRRIVLGPADGPRHRRATGSEEPPGGGGSFLSFLLHHARSSQRPRSKPGRSRRCRRWLPRGSVRRGGAARRREA